MFKRMIFMLIALAFLALGAQEQFLMFDFTGDTTDPALGTGTLLTIGGITTTYVLGWGETSETGQALNTLTYPAQGTNPETAGIEIRVSTIGLSNIQLSWNNRQSSTASSRLRLQYTLDGSTWLNFVADESNATNKRIHLDPIGDVDFDNGLFVYGEANSWFQRSADFTAITGANNNANFAVRFVTAFESGTDQYKPVGTGNYAPGGTIRYDNITFVHFDSNAVIAPVASPPGGQYFAPVAVTLSTATPDATIYYQMHFSETVYTYTEPITIDQYTILEFWAEKEGLNPSIRIKENYFMPIEITSLAHLRTFDLENAGGMLFNITSEVFVTFTQPDFRNQIYVQDDTGGLLIDDFAHDTPPVIQTKYEIGDGITGLIGGITIYDTIPQFNPIVDPGEPTSKSTIIPLPVTIGNLLNDIAAYESRLVVFENVNFVPTADLPLGNFMTARRYMITDGVDEMFFRATFNTADYIGTHIPTTKMNLVGLITAARLPNNSVGKFITARSLDDFRPPTSISDEVPQLGHRLVGNYPNPFNPNTTIAFELKSDTVVNISVFNIRGQKIKTLLDDIKEAGSHTVHWDGTDENGHNMASGLYFYRMHTPETLQVRRAILMK